MKNNVKRNPAELQTKVDHIIQISDIISYLEEVEKKEENHFNVDSILAEPIFVVKKTNDHAEKHNIKHILHPTKKPVPHEHKPKTEMAMPKRERLIVHGEDNYIRRKITVVEIIYSLFKPISNSPRRY